MAAAVAAAGGDQGAFFIDFSFIRAKYASRLDGAVGRIMGVCGSVYIARAPVTASVGR
jgi:hypothetical protein